MTTPRSAAILGALAVIVTVASVWVWSADRAATAAIEPRDEPMFPALQDAKTPVARIELTLPAYHLVLARNGDQWVAPDEGSYPADKDLADRLVAEMSSLRALEPKTTEPALYPKIGVEAEGSRHVTFTDAAGATLADVLVGNRSNSIGATPTGGIFLRHPDEDRAWLARGGVTLPTTLSDWLARPLRIRPADVQAITILEGDRPVFAAAKAAGGAIYEPVAPTTYADDGALKTMTGTLLSISPTSVRPATALQAAADARSIKMQTAAGLDLTIRTGTIDGATWFTFHADAPAGSEGAEAAADINAHSDGFAFRLPDSITGTLLVPLAQLATEPPPMQVPNLPAQ